MSASPDPTLFSPELRSPAHRGRALAPALTLGLLLTLSPTSISAPLGLAPGGLGAQETPTERRAGPAHPGDDALPGPCGVPDGAPDGPSRDLYCIDLVPAPGIEGARGTVELGRVPSPFGAAVTSDGRHLHRPVLELEGLPDPSTLGPYTTYVAWATTPVLRPMVKLGEVGDGRFEAEPVGHDKLLVLVSAEESAAVDDRRGRIVLRGTSASVRMMPHDVPFLTETGQRHTPAPGPHREHGPDEGAAPEAGQGWVAPPMHPGVEMAPAMMGLTPAVRPFRPGEDHEGPVPEARPRGVERLADGDTLELTAGLVRRTIGEETFVMYGFNEQYPGPLIEVDEGSTIHVDFHNRIELPTAIHWHGLRLDNRFDGVPFVTQDPVPPGGRFHYEVHFPDAGVYWYHPHHREDIQQDLGLYGNMLVHSPRPNFYSPVNREALLMLDDLLVGEEGLVPHGREAATHALMGRFGNVLLVNGEPRWSMEVDRGEVVRFFLTNVSNTRTWNLSFGDLPVKVVGSDVGKFEREEFVESVVLSPAERYIVEVLFDEPGEVPLVNRVRGIDHLYGNFFPEADTVGMIRVGEERAERDFSEEFGILREDAHVVAEIDRYRPHFDRPVDHRLVLTMETRDLPFPMEPLMRLDSAYFNPVEWSGTMPRMNWASTAREVSWTLRDPDTGAENMAIDWSFETGEVVKVRIMNDRRAFHAMHHPIHIHGQRFLVLAQNGVPNENLVWKDTMLLPAGHTADILLELSNPGEWMLHCHIAEHLETGMRMVFTVTDPPGGEP